MGRWVCILWLVPGLLSLAGPPVLGQIRTPDDVYVSSFGNGLWLLPGDGSPPEVLATLPTGFNEDVCYDPISRTFVVSSDQGPGPLYRVDPRTTPPTVTWIGDVGVRNEIACDPTQQHAPGFADIWIATQDALVRVDGLGNPVGEPVLTRHDVVDGFPVYTIESLGIDILGSTPCGAGTVFVGTSTRIFALVPPDYRPRALRLPYFTSWFELGVDVLGRAPFDLAAAAFFQPVYGFTIQACDADRIANTYTLILPTQFPTGDDLCFDNRGNIILPNVSAEHPRIDQIGTGVPNVLGSVQTLATTVPEPSGCTVIPARSFAQEVAVDVKPGSCPNPLPTGARGVLAVAVLGDVDLDVRRIDVASLRLEGVAPLRSDLADVATPFLPYTGKRSAMDCTTSGADGFPDLTLKFDLQQVLRALGPVTDGAVRVLHLQGQLRDGRPIRGEDVVVIRARARK